MDKTCIFCHSRVDSREDIWPKWVLRLLKKNDEEIVPMRAYRLNKDPQEGPTTNTALPVGNVCEGCNSGWISRLENDAKAILGPMIFGNAKTLTAVDQERIATWLTKTAMIYDSMDKGEVFYDRLDRHQFWKVPTPFSDSYVWLGNYSESGSLRGSAIHQTLRVPLSSGNSCKMHILTMNLGHLVAQIASVKRLAPDDLAKKIEFPTKGPNLGDALVQVWPANLMDLDWPPVLSLNSEQLKALAFRFGGEKV